jgi:hypothetical protein
VYSSGSNVFGNSLGNTQQFTGSVGVTGSLAVAGAGTFTGVVSATGISTNAALAITLPGNANATILSANSGNSGFGWKLQQEEVSTGDFRIFRRESSVDYQVLNLARSTGAATFSSSLTANGAKPQLYVIGDSGNGAGIFLNTLLSGTNRRNWAIFTEENIDGDFVIKCSTAAGGSPAAGDTRLQITREGNVSIGTTSPGGVFTAQQSNADSLTNVTFDNSATLPASAGTQGTILRFRSRIDDTAIRTTGAIASYAMKTTGAGSNNNGDLRFYTGQEGDTNERMRINSGGFFKASNNGSYQYPTNLFHSFDTSIADWTCTITNKNGSSGNGILITYASAPNNFSSAFLYAQDNAAVRFQVYSNGGIANFQANNVNLSDERTKKNIIPLESYWDKFKAIEIVKFKYKDQTHDDFNIGVIAQQVESVAPEFVDVDGWNTKPELDEEGNEIVSTEEPLKSIYTADLYHATIKVLQEAMTKIEILEAKIQTLEQQ